MRIEPASGLISETYPSGRIITTAFDAQNRPDAVSAPTTTYAGSVTYASSDAVSQIQYGSAGAPIATETTAFDWGSTTLREQPTSITITAGGITPLTLNYWYCAKPTTSCTTNNGNVQAAGIVTPSAYGNLNLTQTFAYDKANRLASASESGGVSEWTQTYGWTAANGPHGVTEAADAYGNHWVSAGTTLSSFTPTASTNFSNNRLIIQNSSYDSAGNQKAIGGIGGVPSYTFNYDAENRLSSATLGGTTNYYYDGNGRRVMKSSASATTVYVYDAAGEVAAEYSTSAPPEVGTSYLMADTLGSTRLALNALGNVLGYHDYLPFGEEIPALTGGRSPSYYGNSDAVTHKFTGKERDSELAGSAMLGLDYFEKRYFSSAQGRFTSSDPLIAFNLKKDEFQEYLTDPQHWNKYAYGLGNPLKFVDPTGLTETVYYWTGNLTDAQKQYFQDHKQEILNAITAKLNQAGIKDVVFKEGNTLSTAQVNSILGSQPQGVAFLNFANKSYGGYAPPPGVFGGENGMRAAVYMGQLQEGNPSPSELAFRVSEVSSHGVGHTMGLYSHDAGLQVLNWIYNMFSHDLMNEGQNMPKSSSPEKFDMTIPQNQKARDQINKLPEYRPKQ